MHAHQAGHRHVHEEPFHRRLCRAQVAMLEVGGHDARVMGPVPGPGGRRVQEADPARHGRLARRSWPPGGQPVGFPRVAEQAFVDRAPPLAAGPRGPRRREHTPTDLPPHERHLGPPVRPDRGAARPVVVEPARQPQPQRRIVPDRRHHGEGFCCGIREHGAGLSCAQSRTRRGRPAAWPGRPPLGSPCRSCGSCGRVGAPLLACRYVPAGSA
jgi:hypothetical protein